jgi:hypothetical protein
MERAESPYVLFGPPEPRPRGLTCGRVAARLVSELQGAQKVSVIHKDNGQNSGTDKNKA